jgi:glycerophosphoryl diester phosphodiesterase
VKRFALPLALLVLTGVPVGQSSAAQEMNAPVLDLVQGHRPLIIGQRGYPTMAPENTLPFFKLALLAGADFVELDYHLTKDGVPLVIHDETLDRTTDATNRWGGVKLAVAAAITLFGADSPAALATGVGVLVEVPVMLSVCKVCNRTRNWYQSGLTQAK